MNATVASTIETPTEPSPSVASGGKKTPDGVEGLFAAVLGETIAEPQSAPGLLVGGISGLTGDAPEQPQVATIENPAQTELAGLLQASNLPPSGLPQGQTNPEIATLPLETAPIAENPSISTSSNAPDGLASPAAQTMDRAPLPMAKFVSPAPEAKNPVMPAGSNTPGVLAAPAGAAKAGPQPLPGAGAPQTESHDAAQAMSAILSGKEQTKPQPPGQAMVAGQITNAKPASGSNSATNEVRKQDTKGSGAKQTPNIAKSSSFTMLIAQQISSDSKPSTEAVPAAMEVNAANALAHNENASASPAARPQLPHQASPVASLAIQVATRAAEGARRFAIRMDPPELGRIDVHLKINDHGVASTRLSVERPETLDMLQRDSRGLERALSDAGLKTDEGGVRLSLKNETGSQQAFSGFMNDGGNHSADSHVEDSNTDIWMDTDIEIPVEATRILTDSAVDIVV